MISSNYTQAQIGFHLNFSLFPNPTLVPENLTPSIDFSPHQLEQNQPSQTKKEKFKP